MLRKHQEERVVKLCQDHDGVAFAPFRPFRAARQNGDFFSFGPFPFGPATNMADSGTDVAEFTFISARSPWFGRQHISPVSTASISQAFLVFHSIRHGSSRRNTFNSAIAHSPFQHLPPARSSSVSPRCPALTIVKPDQSSKSTCRRRCSSTRSAT